MLHIMTDEWNDASVLLCPAAQHTVLGIIPNARSYASYVPFQHLLKAACVLSDLDVEALFRRQPFISYLEVAMRFYGPSVTEHQDPEGQDDLIKAAFSLIAGIVHVCCNQETQLLSGGPALAAPRHYQPPGDTLQVVVGFQARRT
jgi:hypothetical protein